MSPEIALGLHAYQPERRASHYQLKEVQTDPQGVDWTKRIIQECYKPLAEEGVFEKVSFDISPVLLERLSSGEPDIARLIKEQMRVNGIGVPFIHPLLPDLSYQDKCIVIGAGLKYFERMAGQRPKFFWSPETALDQETLVVLAEFGYLGFICAPEQIILSDGRKADNIPTGIELSDSRKIVALPFDSELSRQLAFHPKKNADRFVNEFIKPKTGSPDGSLLIAWTDAETFGHHWKFADLFLTYLLAHSLETEGITPVSVNELELVPDKLPLGRLRERTTWSCPHGNLTRWHGQCGCGSDGNDVGWKQPFYLTFRVLNEQISDLVGGYLRELYVELITEGFEEALYNPGGLRSNPRLSLISAKVSSLNARTSCGTFFPNLHTSGRINIVYAYQAVLHLKDAGLTKQASEIENQLRRNLSLVKDPIHPGKTGVDILEEMLGNKGRN